VLIAFASDARALIDVALTLALLAAISGIAFAQRAWGTDDRDDAPADRTPEDQDDAR
jgi:multicomponent Na+:H+ antiporter subunit F